MPKIHYTHFPVTTNLLPTSRCNGIWETTRHDELLPAPTFYRLVADLLRGSR